MRVQTAATTSVMVDSISSATKALGAVNKQMNPAGLQKTIRDFEIANFQMTATEEMMDDALIDAFDMDDEMETEVKHVSLLLLHHRPTSSNFPTLLLFT